VFVEELKICRELQKTFKWATCGPQPASLIHLLYRHKKCVIHFLETRSVLYFRAIQILHTPLNIYIYSI